MTATPGPQQPDEEWVGHWTEHDGQPLTDAQREEAIEILLEFGNVEAANALRPAAPSGQPVSLSQQRRLEVQDAHPVRDTEEGRR